MRVRKRNLLEGRMDADFASTPRTRFKPRMLFGAIFLLAIPLVATTFAAQVTISGTQGGAIEFGQGNQAAVACDTSIQTSVGEIWSSAQTNFIVDTVTLMNLDVNSGSLSSTISNQGCGLKTLKVALYDTSSVQTAIGADSSTLVSFGVPTTDGSITPLTGNLGGSTNISATLINSTETITAVSAVNSDTSVTYTYSATSYASTYPMAVGDYVTITGTTGCNYSGAYVSAVTAVSGGSGTFTVNQSSTSGCATASGLNAKVYGKGVIQFTLPATTLNFVATRVGRVSLESQ